MMKRMFGANLLALVLAVLLPVAVAGEAPASSLFVVHFMKGSGWDDALAPTGQRGFKEHSANLGKLRREGSISFGARYGEYGMIFLQAESLGAAEAVIKQDPAVVAGTFAYRIAELHVFYDWNP